MRSAAICVGLAGCWGQTTVEPHLTPTTPTAVVTAATPRASRGPYADVSGEWRGIGTQYDDNTQWPAVITLYPGGGIGQEIGTVEYPTLDCGGVLIRRPELTDGTLVLYEKITHGKRCVDGGTWQIPPRPDGERLEWRWFMPNDGKENAAATLERAR